MRNIVYVGGDLIIKGNPSLKSLDAFRNLEAIGGNLELDVVVSGFMTSYSGNDLIETLTGFNSLEKVNGDFFLHPNYNIGADYQTGCDYHSDALSQIGRAQDNIFF